MEDSTYCVPRTPCVPRIPRTPNYTKCNSQKTHDTEVVCMKCNSQKTHETEVVCMKCNSQKTHDTEVVCMKCNSQKTHETEVVCMKCNSQKTHEIEVVCMKCNSQKTHEIEVDVCSTVKCYNPKIDNVKYCQTIQVCLVRTGRQITLQWKEFDFVVGADFVHSTSIGIMICEIPYTMVFPIMVEYNGYTKPVTLTLCHTRKIPIITYSLNDECTRAGDEVKVFGSSISWIC